MLNLPKKKLISASIYIKRINLHQIYFLYQLAYLKEYNETIFFSVAFDSSQQLENLSRTV